MAGEEQTSSRKLGAVIYLRTIQPLQLAKVGSTFQTKWPGLLFTNEGRDGNIAYFAIRASHVAVELNRKSVPQAITSSALPSESWPAAATELSAHVAYLKIVASADPGPSLKLASDLTKLVVALLSITDPIGVCWLNESVANGSVLHPSGRFAAIANEMFSLGLLPLMLWIGVHWKAEEHVIHTTGMLEFGAPEIILAQQAQPSGEMVEYLFEFANYLLTSGREISAGETIDGPKGLLRIESMNSGDPSRRLVILVPVRPN